jgi:hypothetical protein
MAGDWLLATAAPEFRSTMASLCPYRARIYNLRTLAESSQRRKIAADGTAERFEDRKNHGLEFPIVTFSHSASSVV